MSKEFIALCRKVRQDLVEYYAPDPFRPAKTIDMHLLSTGKWRFFDEDFLGACGVASYMMTILARQKKIPLVLAGHDCHFFCYDPTTGNVVDATYEQFDKNRPIYIGQPTSFHAEFSVGDLAKQQLKRYPETQNPFSSYHKRTLQRWMNANE